MAKKTTKGFTHESTYNESKEWYTPRYIFEDIGIEFDMDVASPGKDIVPWIPAKKHLTIFEDGLSTDWTGQAFVNPPYGMDTPKWIRKLRLHGQGMALVFSRTDTTWFHDYVPLADAILFIKGRVQFIPAKAAEAYTKELYKPTSGCGAGSMLVAFGETCMRALIESELGWVFYPADVADWPCPSSKHTEMFRAESAFAGGSRRPHENLPRNAESGQGILWKQ